MKNNIFPFLIFMVVGTAFAQTADSLSYENQTVLVVKDSLPSRIEYDPLAPARAAFYSAVVPGLGQVYNKKYWKVPIIYAGMAAGVYFYVQNDNDYDRFRNAYKRRLAGFTDDEFYGDGEQPLVSNERLINAQRNAQKNKDVSIIVSLAFYLLNVVDANVDAHLKQYNVSDDLSVHPKVNVNPVNSQTHYGMSLIYNFK